MNPPLPCLCRSFAFGAACIGILGVNAGAAVTFSNPVRSVSAGNNKGSSQAIETQGFDPFHESARVDWEEEWAHAETTGQYFSTATQESIIGLTGVTARGSVLGTGSFEFYGESSLLQNAQSYFKVNILLDAPGNIHLYGLTRAERDPWGTNYENPEILVTLTGANGEYYSKNISRFDYVAMYEYVINESFISLPTGNYEFIASVKTDGNYDNFGDPGVGGYGNATYDISLLVVIPEPSSMLFAVFSGLLIVMRRTR